MQVFELHFNPKLKEDQIFDSFVYEPENIQEKTLGSLYIVGELQNSLPQNLKLLDAIARVIKKNYYTISQKSPEAALSKSLKKANEYLAEEVKNDNVGWLGNLNFAVLSLKGFTPHLFPEKKGEGFNLVFTKAGNLKILLLRAGQIIDIGKNLDLREIEPYPLKVFLNVVSGKLIQDDIILVLTKEIFEFFFEQNLLSKIAKAENIDAKKIKEILPASLFAKGKGSKVSGICFLSIVKTEVKKGRTILGWPAGDIQKEKKLFPFKIFSSFLKAFQKIPKPNFRKIPLPKLKKVGLPKLKVPIKSPGPIVEKPRPQINIKKKLILILVLIFVLVIGFLIFKKAGEMKEGGIKQSLAEIQEKVNQAESFLIFKNDEEANNLLRETWEEILPLTEKENSLTSEILSLKKTIEENLEKLNKLEKIENPEPINEPDPNLFSSPSNSLVEPPSFEFNFDLSASYLSSFYFLDKETCEIIKYSHSGGLNWGSPKKWMKDKGPCSNPKSITVDGSIWILNGDNSTLHPNSLGEGSILRYYAGILQETIIPDFFPLVEDISKIKTGPDIPYLYLLEPVKNRVVIIDKKGKIIKQFQSDKFDNLKDLDISPDGKTIYLLNSLMVYKISL